MKEPICSKAALGRLPIYLDYLRTERPGETVSAAEISRALGLGDVQVRKDLNAVSGTGRPKVGYKTSELIADLEAVLGRKAQTLVVIAGKLGRALLDFEINFWLNEKHTPGFIAYQIEKAVEEYLEEVDEIDRMTENEVNSVTFYKE